MNEILLLVVGILAGIITALAIGIKEREPTNTKFVKHEKDDELSQKAITIKTDLSPIKEELIAILDQKMAEINAKIDSLTTKPHITKDATNKDDEKRIEEEAKELEDIKKRISDALSNLEKTEIG
ncbi:MAG: hypothetical protein QW416_04365 [Candidatus Nitrosocaldaceae archaeon]